MTSVSAGKMRHLRTDVAYYTNQIVNVVFIGLPNQAGWTLIDAGMPFSSGKILKEAQKRFGKNKPAAIILTHGHFDHVGGITELIKEWKVPVYAHPLEFPYLTGAENYPEPDPSVQGGILAKISSVYPHEPIQIEEALHQLPADGSLPGLPGWKWIHTPGHSRGHVSFFRPADKTLVAGDAFVTVRQDSLYKVLIQKEEINGPPNYFTPDWASARASVKLLEALQPEAAVTGHGDAMTGEKLAAGLKDLAENFDKIAIPAHGKYVNKNDRDDINSNKI